MHDCTYEFQLLINPHFPQHGYGSLKASAMTGWLVAPSPAILGYSFGWYEAAVWAMGSKYCWVCWAGLYPQRAVSVLAYRPEISYHFLNIRL